MPESYELSSRSPSPTHDMDDSAEDHMLSRSSRSSSIASIDELDPLKATTRPYRDDQSEPLGPTFNSIRPTTRRRTGWRRWLFPSRMCCWMIGLFFVSLVLLLSAGGIWVYKKAVPTDGESEPWYPSPRGGTVKSWEESYKKAADLVQQMTLVEMVNITTGTGWEMGPCVGNTGPVSRLGFPSLCLQDGPLGIRFADNITAFPAGITVGATWNKDLMYQRGRAHALEARGKGINVLLGPSMGAFGRLPAGGRNWEGFGPDPVLQGIAAAQTIRGIQDQGVIATAKHWVANEQEHFRQSWEWGLPNAISSNIDDRTLHEIYAWPFSESVRAGVGSAMCSYNQINNSYACQNSKLMNGILKDELGFQGFVQSDWLAQRSGVASALAGLDMSMPGDGLIWQDGVSLWGGELTKSVLNGSLPTERINDMTMRIVAAWYQLGQDNKTAWPAAEDGGGPNFSSWTNDRVGKVHPGSDDKTTGVVNQFVDVQGKGKDAHSIVARRVAAEGTVLVKNEDNVLPLARDGNTMTKSGDKLKIGIFGEGAYNNPDGINSCADRGCNVGALAMGWGSGAVELPYLVAPADALHANFDHDTVEITDVPKNSQFGQASSQDMCIVFVSSDAGEGFVSWNGIKGDRNNLYAQNGGDELVKNVASKCGGNGQAPTIVVYHTVGPVILEEWIDLPGVKAVLIAHLPGEESGNALADVIFGDVNPSGRLPYTIAKREEDYGPTSKIMYTPNGVVPQQNFTEGLYMDYRYFDKHDIAPRYEFGYGLSYTTFHLSSLLINPASMTRTALPAARPAGVTAPSLEEQIPDPEDSLWPTGIRKLKKYVYPYIDSVKDIKKGTYPYPKGYELTRSPSPAGGDQGGNPDLFKTAVSVQASLTNLGTRDGDCVVQCYISFPADMTDSQGQPIDMPVRVLRQFDKISVGTSNSKKRAKVSMELTRKDLSYWDVHLQNWVMPEKGSYNISLGYSSRNLEVSGQF